MGVILVSLIKYLGVSVVLWLIYRLLFKGKSSFIAQRIYLLSIPITSLVAATLSLELFEVEQHNSIGRVIASANNISEAIPLSNEFVVIPYNESATLSALSVVNLLMLLSAIVSVALLLSYIKGVRRIYSIRKLSSISEHCGVPVCRSGLVETPFSFISSIYIDRKIDGEKLDMVLTHEMAHINRLHYVDKMVSKMYTIVSWFNPVVWSIQRELESVHEFEADYNVINSRFDQRRYKQYLFDELMFASPSMSSGFNNSLIKQRFLQMKNNYKIRNKMLRKILTLPAIALVLVLTSFTYVNEDVIVSNTDKTVDAIEHKIGSNDAVVTEPIDVDNYVVSDSGIENDKVSEMLLASSEPMNVAPQKKKSIKVQRDSLDVIKRELEVMKGYVMRERDSLNSMIENLTEQVESKKSDPKAKYNYYYLKNTQYSINRERRDGAVTVYRCKDHTEVDFVVRSAFDEHWVNFSKNTFLVDKTQLDKYKIHSIKGGAPIDRNLVICNEAGRQVVITLIFPPLKKDVKYVDLVEESSDTLLSPPNGNNRFVYRKILVQDGRPKRKSETIITLDPDFKL